MDELAIQGGPQACPAGTLPQWPVFDEREEQGLLRTLRSRLWWRVPGHEVDAFEGAFAKFLEVPKVLGVSNGTQAIELALACLDIGFGDEVIVPAYTFASTVTAVLQRGATPVLVDVDLDTYCVTPEAMERAVTKRTRALLPVHLAGQSCDMEGIQDIARRHGLRVIADAAHAHGARFRDQSVARLCDVAIYSFQSGKLMTAGEGGAVAFNDPVLSERAFVKHSCGRPRSDRKYQHVELGTNMRMTEFQGAVLQVQLERLKQHLSLREQSAGRLDVALSEIPGLHLQRREPGVSLHSHYMYMVRVDPQVTGLTRDQWVDQLVAEGVPAFYGYPSLAEFSMFDRALWPGAPPEALTVPGVREGLHRFSLEHASELGRDALWLHHAVLLGDASAQQSVANAFQKVAGKARR